jgi:XTP/dITP diphosphohydrolase
MASCGEATAVDIILASRNPGKRQEFAQIFALYEANHLRLVSPGADAPQVAETGRSYRANARLKAEAFASHYTSAALGDDSGLVVDALQGAPGLRTARFGGPGLDDAQRVELLLDRLRGVPPERRGAHFVCALYLAYPDGTAVAAQGYVYGRIAGRPAGTHGFGYDPIFLLPRLGCTLAELLPGEKHRLSHRGRAVRRLLRRLGAYGAAGGSNRRTGNER